MKVLRYPKVSKAEIIETETPRIKENQALSKSIVSNVSAGTELAFYRGVSPESPPPGPCVLSCGISLLPPPPGPWVLSCGISLLPPPPGPWVLSCGISLLPPPPGSDDDVLAGFIHIS